MEKIRNPWIQIIQHHLTVSRLICLPNKTIDIRKVECTMSLFQDRKKIILLKIVRLKKASVKQAENLRLRSKLTSIWSTKITLKSRWILACMIRKSKETDTKKVKKPLKKGKVVKTTVSRNWTTFLQKRLKLPNKNAHTIEIIQILIR